MGSFSWKKADNLTQVSNVVCGSVFKFLIPKPFGGGFIRDHYQDYGHLGRTDNGEPKYDMYELLAFWNAEKLRPGSLRYEGSEDGAEPPLMKEIDEHTDHNRGLGINIGCYDNEIDRLQYPLKLVSASFKGTYEDLETRSYGDPAQGFYPTKREKV